MAANPAYMDDAARQSRPTGRSWASNVPYDLIDDDVIDVRPAQASARATGATTAQRPLRQTMNLNFDDIPSRPTAATTTTTLRESSSPLISRSTARLGLYAALAAVAVVLLYVIVSSAVHWTQIKLDDLAYGNPRTTHLDAVVGHGDSAAQPTHFIALNLNRQVSVIEIPGGDISKAVAISGPYLFGDEENLTPVKLSITDLNGDGLPDLLVDVKSEQMAYINAGSSFRPINADEKAAVESAALKGSK